MKQDKLISRDEFLQEASSFGLNRGVMLNQVANFAKELADHFSLVLGMEDGEDSAGRQKLRLATPQEVATRSCDVAQAMYAEFEKRGWLLEVPDAEPDKDEPSEQ